MTSLAVDEPGATAVDRVKQVFRFLKAFAEKNLERQKILVLGEGTSQKAMQETQQQLDAARVQQEVMLCPLIGS